MHVLWRGPGEVQIGTEPGQATIFSGLSEAEERVLLSVPRLSEPARERARLHHGITDTRWAEFRSHFIADTPYRPARGSVITLDTHPITERIRVLLERIGIESAGGGALEFGQKVAVLTSPWVTDPTRIHPLIAADVPYLPIVVGGSGTVVGPSVVPGATACTTCLHLALAEADPKWPVVATQLASTPQRRLTRVEVETAAALATHALTGLLLGRITGGWLVSDERCAPLDAPSVIPCGCGFVPRSIGSDA